MKHIAELVCISAAVLSAGIDICRRQKKNRGSLTCMICVDCERNGTAGGRKVYNVLEGPAIRSFEWIASPRRDIIDSILSYTPAEPALNFWDHCPPASLEM